MFSPYYAWARARGRGDPENHVTFNVALDGRPRRWAMTERGRAALARDAGHIAIAASAMRWDGSALEITFNETTVPVPSRLRGRVIIRPRAVGTRCFNLDAAGRHRWQPIGPATEVEVALDAPALRWRGTGYFDTNNGDEPLENAFRSWTWSRFDDGRGGARIFYDVVTRDGERRGLSLAATASGVADAATLPFAPLPGSLWRIERTAPCDEGHAPRLMRTMEDAPFYARTGIRSSIDGIAMTGVNESLSLTRAASPAVRLLLPFKMVRRRTAPNGGVGG